jgi:predicted transposase/invertase (TIGR01784 family)
MQDTFINPFTDFGFKKLFGEEPNKDLLISFLNTLLPATPSNSRPAIHQKRIPRRFRLDRKAIFDLNCTSTSGERFVVELQKAKQNYFKDRSLYYATFPIQEQAQRGDWNYQLAAVYTVGILDFVFEEDQKAHDHHRGAYRATEKPAGSGFLRQTDVHLPDLPHFEKTLDELANLAGQMVVCVPAFVQLQEVPAVLQEAVFTKLFEKARLAPSTPPSASSMKTA